MPDPGGVVPFRLRPGSQGRLFQSPIVINRLGFRGKDIPAEKGGAYRIIALGESTTFGCTLGRDDRPWPELLEELIRQRLHPRRPLQVINAGVPAYDLTHNVARWRTDLAPLQPDLLLSYHGANGFRMLDEALPSLIGRFPPIYKPRPLKLLADCEYRLRILYYRRRQTLDLTRPARRPLLSDVAQSKYAGAYGQLIQIAQTNHLRLALANFSLAVNQQSAPEVVEFYGTSFPLVARMIQANQAHSRLLEILARQHPEICLVDTHPGLDGVHQKFINMGHLTQPGRQQLAENIFAGIKKVLEEDLK